MLVSSARAARATSTSGSAAKRRATLGIGRFVVEGDLATRATALPESADPAVVLGGRDLLVALTDCRGDIRRPGRQ
jgi:hypothetical protein